jgi:hypothetical protein
LDRALSKACERIANEVIGQNIQALEQSRQFDSWARTARGRPILNPVYAADPIAKERVEKSKILLNIDHPDFNSKRERLCRDIAEDVEMHEALREDSESRVDIRARMERRLAANAPFSTAARYYLQFHRNLSWVEELLKQL